MEFTEQSEAPTETEKINNVEKEKEQMDYKTIFQGLKLAQNTKGFKDNNPIMTQRFGADPYAMVYGDRVYFYMTQDAFEYDKEGNLIENTYSKINTISVVSTDDMVNFTDHGEMKIAGKDGAAKWANNSWAPAAAWKEINGKPKFFLYFADAGGGIGVVSSDSPTGPFVDELGKGLIRRDMPNCGNVLWLFDPAVLVDEDNRAYLYFGGGVPEGKIAQPGTGRAVELGEDMMSIVGEPVALDVPYLFEDSGIHKYKDTYYYTYCSNWQVDEAGTAKYGFYNAEIVSLESKSPLGPFTFKEVILKNPGQYCGLYGNNHHCVFSFKDQWYITYHTRMLEKQMGIEKGYRATSIDAFAMGEDGTIGYIDQTKNGRKQIKQMNMYEPVSASTMALIAGADTIETNECGKMLLGNITEGGFVKLEGVDFGEAAPKALKAVVRSKGNKGVIRMTIDVLNGEAVGYLEVNAEAEDFAECVAQLEAQVTGIHDVYFTFSGEGYEVAEWQLMK